MKEPKKIWNDNITGTKMSMQATEENPDAGLVAALAGDDGPLQAGALPAMETSCPDGEKALAEALNYSVVKQKKTNSKPASEKAKKVDPTTMKEIL